MPLTDAKIRSAKTDKKQMKLSDGDGLYLLVKNMGGKYWRFKYRFDGKEKTLSLGVYPDVPLRGFYQENGAEKLWIDGARDLCTKARQQLAADIDPGTYRKAQRETRQELAGSSFEIVAREWHKKYKRTWSEGHAKTILRRLELNVFPWLGKSVVSEINSPELLKVLRKIEKNGFLETAHRVRYICSQVFCYAIATGRAERDPSIELKRAIPPASKKHLAAITDPDKVKGLLKAIDSYEGSFSVKCALRLAPLVFVRPGELRQAEWSEIDLDKAEWNIPASRMKMKEPHLVPLSRQSVEILRELHKVTSCSTYLFPSGRSNARPMSDNAILAALRRMGYEKEEMTGHGFRAMARTILDEVLGFRVDFIEHQLAHAVRDPNGRAYNRTAHLEERKKMMQHWADYLDGLKENRKVIPIKKQA